MNSRIKATTYAQNRRCSSIGAAILAILLLPAVARAQSYTITPTPFQTVFNNSGAIVNNACVWTYQAGTTTPATTYSDTSGTPNANPIRTDSAGRFTAYLVAGSNYKYVYETACTPPAHGTTLRTADNIAGVPASAASIDVTGTAGETLSAGQCAYLSDGSGGKTTGQWFRCDSGNTYSSVIPEVGLVPTAITSGASGTIRLAGAVTGLSSLSVGSSYYISTAGALTTSAPSNRRLLGVADSATSLVLFPASIGANGTATNVLHGTGGYSAVALGSDVSGVLPASNGGTAMTIATTFETTGRFAAASLNGTGANTFDTTGVQLQTGANAGSTAGERWNLATSSGGFFVGSPRFSAHLSLTTKGSDCQFYTGIGAITVAGAGLTFTDAHIGFKITWSGSGTASLFATQAAGTETASSALTTVVAGDELDLFFYVNGTTSVDYYWRKNGGALSSATNLSTNQPSTNTSAATPHAAISNVSVASASTVTMHGMSVSR